MMIVADSGCDLTPELRARLGVRTVPLTLLLGDTQYTDDENIDVGGFLADMKAFNGPARSSAPSPGLFAEAFEAVKSSFAVVISSRLSGTYGSAQNGVSIAREENPEVEAHIFDSKSAAAGETLCAIKLRELIDLGLAKEQIITVMNKFIAEMKTYFVLEKYENLVQNGRIGRITEKVLNIMNLRLICGDDGDGNIKLHDKSKEKNLVENLVAMIKKNKRPVEGSDLVISHCFNPELAQRVADAAKSFNFREIFIVPTGGMTSMYAEERGVVMAF